MKRIEEFTENELIEELSKRYNHFCMAGRKDLNDGSKDTAIMVDKKRFFSGDYEVCIGLAHGIIQSCVNRVWGVPSEDVNY